MSHPRVMTCFAACLLALGLSLPSLAGAGSAGESGRDSKKPNPLKNVYFGEQHLHSENSPDAFAADTRQKRAWSSPIWYTPPSHD